MCGSTFGITEKQRRIKRTNLQKRSTSGSGRKESNLFIPLIRSVSWHSDRMKSMALYPTNNQILFEQYPDSPIFVEDQDYLGINQDEYKSFK